MDWEQEDLTLLRNPRFRRLLESRLIGQTAQNATLYTLLILVAKDTGSSIQSTLLLVAFTLPAVIFSIPAGTMADLLPKRFTLTLGYVLKAAIVVMLIAYVHNTPAIFLLAAAFATVGQFFSPAESAVVPGIVRREQLTAANAMMVFTLILGQVLGLVVIAPFLVRALGARAVFVIAALLFLSAAYFIGWLASGFTAAEEERTRSPSFPAAMQEGFRILRTNRRAYLAIVYLTVATALFKVLVVLMPRYTEDVLRISAEDTAFVVAPAAIGAALGLLLAPLFAHVLGAWRVVAIGFLLFILGLLGLGFVVYVRDFIQSHLDLGISFVEREAGVSSVITVTMLLAIPMGMAFSLLSVAGRVVLNEQAPPEVQGRVFAVQIALGDLLSLVPLLIVGVIADVVGVRATLLVATAAGIAAAGYLTFSRRMGPRAGPPPETRLQPTLAAAPEREAL